MSFALQPTSIIPVKVLHDWSNSTLFTADVIAALEASFPGVFVFPAADAIVLTLLQVQSGITVKAILSIADTTGTGTVSHDFDATPAVGSVVYVIDMY
jgi:hypothetical protein